MAAGRRNTFLILSCSVVLIRACTPVPEADRNKNGARKKWRFNVFATELII